MPSFDVISKVNQQELTNAISNCNREISTRFDFKGLHIVIEANQKENLITVVAPDDLKLKQVNELLKGHLIKRKMDPRVYNGASFLGLNGIVVKSHGGTDAFGFCNAIGVAVSLIENSYINQIEKKLKFD